MLPLAVHRFGIGALVHLEATRGPVAARVFAHTARPDMPDGGRSHAEDGAPLYQLVVVEGIYALREGGYIGRVPDQRDHVTPRHHRLPLDDEAERLHPHLLQERT